MNFAVGPKLRRWASVGLAALFGVGICVLLIPVLDKTAELLGDYFERFEIQIIYVLSIICLLATGYKGSDWGIFCVRHLSFRPFLSFPPIWFAGLLGTVAYVAIRTSGIAHSPGPFSSMSLAFVVSCGLVATLSIVIGASIQWCLSRGRQDRTNVQNAKSCGRHTDFKMDERAEKFITWLQNEEPIRAVPNDLYGRGPIAHRIARRLREDGFQTIGITGDYGCGKSSIIAMTRSILNEPRKSESSPQMEGSRKLIECHISTWGLSRENIAQHILTQIVRALSEHVDTVALRSVPKQYISALNGVGGNWAESIFHIASQPTDPLEVLDGVDKVLHCLNWRLVAFIEDADRNSSSDMVKIELFALLDRLKLMKNISFVVAIGNESGLLEELIRVLEHIEPIQSLQRDEARSVLVEFRRIAKNVVADKCFSLYNDDELDTRIGISRSAEDLFDMVGLNEEAAMTHMAALLNTPRVKKLVLRRTWSGWQSLFGEVDLDELLVVNILKCAIPAAYAFISDNLNEIRRVKGDPQKQELIRAKLIEKVPESDGRGEHARALIRFLFPGAFDGNSPSSSALPQRVAETFVNDYWVRIAREELQQGDEPRDQAVLHAIAAWSENSEALAFDGRTMADALIDIPRFAELVELLAIRLDLKEVKLLTSQLFARLTARNIEIRCDPDVLSTYPGSIELWRMLKSRTQKVDVDWLLNELSCGLERNLLLSNYIYYYWRPDDLATASSIYKTYVANAKSLFSEDVQRFVNVLPRGYPFSLYHFCVHYSETQQLGPGFESLDWKWLGKVLLQASLISPEVVVPHVLVLVTNEHRDPQLVRQFTFQHERAEAFWGRSFKKKLQSIVELGSKVNLGPEDLRRSEAIAVELV